MKTSFADILTSMDTDRAGRLTAKVPEWEGLSLEIPDSLSLEQCSSSATARYKASLAARIPSTGAGALADLTGGLGVDSWAFAGVFGKVIYNEMDPLLASCAGKNFKTLGKDNVTVRCGSAESLLEEDWQADIIYLDPARRSSTGKKVFLVEDCRPDVLSLLPELFRHSGDILVKLSPMADIAMLRGRFGSLLRQIHITGTRDECKEILLHLRRVSAEGESAPEAAPLFLAVTCRGREGMSTLTVTPGEDAGAALLGSRSELEGLRYFFVPGPVLQKAQADAFLYREYGLHRFGKSTHVFPCGETLKELEPFGKFYRADEILSYGKSTLKELGRRFPKAEVTARNLPLSSEELRKRIGCAPGGGTHIFALTADFADHTSERLLILSGSRL